MFQTSIQLGDTVRDTITDFQGIVVARIEYLTGCMQFGVAPKAGSDGKVPDTVYFDYTRLEVVADKKRVVIPARDTGGPQRDAPRH